MISSSSIYSACTSSVIVFKSTFDPLSGTYVNRPALNNSRGQHVLLGSILFDYVFEDSFNCTYESRPALNSSKVILFVESSF